MLEFEIPIIIPSYLCHSRLFGGFLQELSNIGIKKAIVLFDFDPLNENIYSYKRESNIFKNSISPAFKRASIAFKVLPNFLLYNHSYSARELTCLVKDSFPYCFLTLPLFCDQSIAMENIFTVKNSGVKPIINSFNNVCLVNKNPFTDAIITTEDISFVFEETSLVKKRVLECVNKSLTYRKTVLFSAESFMACVMERDLSAMWNALDPQMKMNLGYLSRLIIKQAFK